MPVAEFRERINAPAEKVWELLCDIERAPDWVTVMLELVHTTHNPVQLGTVYRERSKVGPSTSETEWRVTRFEPPKIQVQECDESGLRAVLTMAVEPDGDGCVLTHRTEYKLMPSFRPLGLLLETLFGRRTMNRELGQSVKNFVRLAESEAGA